MKKLIAFALTTLFSLPIFALPLSVGDSFDYLPTKDGKEKSSVVTKIAPSVSGKYELTLLANGVYYSYTISEGTRIYLYTKSPVKAKSMIAKTITITSVNDNSLEFDSINGGTVDSQGTSAK